MQRQPPAWMVHLAQRENERRFTEAVGDPVRSEIEAAIADVGMPPDAPWIWATTARHELGGEGMITGQLVAPAHIIGRGGLIPFWFATPYPWNKDYRGYRFELFARQCPREAIWRMRIEDDPALDGPGVLELAVWRARVIHHESPVIGRADWRPGWPRVKHSHDGIDPTVNNDTRRADDGLKLLRDIPLSHRGKREGDGQLWPGGVPDFLDDLWSTIEKWQAQTGKRWGFKVASREFRHGMREHPSRGAMYAWLGKAELRPQDIESGQVTRANYAEFVGRRAP